MSLSSAGAIHLVLTPAHFREQTLYGVFFLAAAAFQLGVAQLLVLAPAPWVYRSGLYGSATLIATWIVTRAVAPPLAESAEPVTVWGVLAKGFELTALFLLLAVPPPERRTAAARGVGPRRARSAWGWSVVTGAGFISLFLLSSGGLIYVPAALPAPALTIDPWQGPSLTRPWVEGPLTSHLYINAAWSTLLFALLAGALLAVATGLTAGLSRLGPAFAPGTTGYLGIAPALVAVPSCCGVPLAGFLGLSVVPFLLRATPWLLVATTVAPSAYVVALGRLWRKAVDPRSPDHISQNRRSVQDGWIAARRDDPGRVGPPATS